MKNLSSNDPLPRSTPEQQGLPSRAILAFLESLESPDFQVHSFMLLRHGHVIAEACWHPYDRACRRYLYSLSKSFTSTAIGFAVGAGLLEVEQKVVSFFGPDLPSEISPNLAAMRVKDLLTMSTGHAVDTTGLIMPPGLVNWARAILSAPVEFPPGTHFLYNSGATYLLSCIVQQVTGQTVLDYLAPRLFEPLGIHGMTWETCPRGFDTGGWGLSLAVEDLAKFGQFYLQQGRWEDRQLLSPAWVEEATSARVPKDSGDAGNESSDWAQGYGYQFWRCRHNAYRADGAYGQYCIVMPDQDAVLALTSETPDMQQVLDRLWQHLLPPMGSSPLPADLPAQNTLQSRLASLEIPLPPACPPPAKMDRFSGKQFALKDNPLGLQALSLSFGQDLSVFHLWDAAEAYQLGFGKGAWKRSETWLPLMKPTLMSHLLGQKDRSPLKVAAAGQWKDAETLLLVVQYLETPHSTTFKFKFHGDELHLEVHYSMINPSDPLIPRADLSFVGLLQPSPSPIPE
jgi:hypothetical protein